MKNKLLLLLSILILMVMGISGCKEAVVEISTPVIEKDVEVSMDEVDEIPIVTEVVYKPQDVPESMKNEAVIAYQIFPVSFNDSDDNGVGDIQGITNSLDYLKDELHVDVIWLNPIHPSPSYHKYDVTDYYGIDSELGTLADYEMLLIEAHNRGIKVLLDFVINHTSSKHPWFLEAKSSEDSQYRDYYVWNTLQEEEFVSTNGWYGVAGSDEKYFASFWNEMPELNFDNPEVRETIKNIAKYWLELGVDGFRIDAAKHVYDINEYPKGTAVMEENYNWFIEFNQYIKEVKPEAFLLLETWDNYNSVASFLEGADSAFNFDLGESIISAVVSENRKNIQGKFSKIHESYDKVTDQYIDSVFLANHDQDRTMSQLGGSLDKGKLVASIEFTLPGLSWIYYGEELGMTGTKPDEDIREAFKWKEEQSESPNSQWRPWKYAGEIDSLAIQSVQEDALFSTYKTLTTLKSTNMVLRNGDYIDYEIGTSFRVFAFFRVYEGTTYMVLHNLHDETHSFNLSEAPGEIIYSTMGSVVLNNTIILEPYGSMVVEVSSEVVTAEEIK